MDSFIDKKPKSEDARVEVLTNLKKRLNTVRDDVFDDLYVSRSGDGQAAESGLFIGTMHRQLFKMVSFFKGRSGIRKKMVAMVHGPIHFDDKDFDILAQDFDIDMAEAPLLA